MYKPSCPSHYNFPHITCHHSLSLPFPPSQLTHTKKKFSMTDDDWVKAAMADDSIVGDLLLHLNRPQNSQRHSTPALPLDWSVRQRRSRKLILPAKNPTSTRASPTTPLSWSGATSGSGGGDEFEESNRSHTKRSSTPSRSKVIGTTEATSSKRPRKKKTLAELKVEEDWLLKERNHLNRKLISMRVTLEKQRTENEGLKRIKVDISLQSEGKIVTAVESISGKTTPKNNTTLKVADQCNVSIAFPKPLESRSPMECLKEVVNKLDCFMLPDLNVAIEEEFS